ncbi:MAG: hypothetical protein Q9159_000409 [Coniocarpon cinnabarinum]
MGAAVSHEIAERLQVETANDCITDTEFQDFLRHSATPDASDFLRNVVAEMLRTPRDRLKPLFEADMDGPVELEQIHEIATGRKDLLQDRLTSSASQAYVNIQMLMDLRDPSLFDDVLRRLQLYILFLLKEKFDRENNAKPGAFANTIVASLEGTNRVLPNTRHWLRSGAILYRVAADLGGIGTLFVLPRNVSRSIWESHLSPNAPRYYEAINYLRAQSLAERATKSGAMHAGISIVRSLGFTEDSELLIQSD